MLMYGGFVYDDDVRMMIMTDGDGQPVSATCSRVFGFVFELDGTESSSTIDDNWTTKKNHL